MKFPTSISEHGDRLAALVSIHDNSESYYLQWLVIKKVKTDKIEQIIALVDAEFSSKLATRCRDGLSSCIHKDEVEQRLQAANAVLSRHRWRAFPCYRKLRTGGLTRFGSGCEEFRDLTADYQDTWLLVSHRARVVLNERRPTWAYRGESCKRYMTTDTESIAYDPETGVFVVGIGFSPGVEGCDTPIWDFHPIRVPMLGRGILLGRDGGVP